MNEVGAMEIEGAARGSRSHFGFAALVAWLAITLMWWFFAFAPLPAPPVWLAEARAVCFGMLPNGLPEPWGWGSLIVTPLAMLGFLLAVWGSEVRRDLGTLASARGGRALLLALVAVPLVGLVWVAGRVAEARRLEAALLSDARVGELPESYPRGTDAAPTLDLIDQSGARFDLPDAAGRPILMTFAFAHCKTVCPIVVDTVRSAAAEVPELSPVVVVVTLDPWRDTPGSLPSLARAWKLDGKASAHVLSGEVAEVDAVLRAWRMPAERDLQTGDIVHPAIVHVVDPEGRLAYSFQNPPVGWVAEAARRVAAG
jgi:cytochrome oxidase Cu insertion factor (SCO1/SenC/PrrC family)